jgi:type IV pilus assembly protein PilM
MQITRKREKGLVGLEIEAGSVAATEVRANGSARVTATAISPLPPDVFRDGEVADSEALAEALRELFSKNKLSKQVRLGIANQRVVVRTLRLPALDDPKELEAAVRFQAQEQIPMPIDQAILDHRVVGGAAASGEGSAKVDVVVVAARRDMISASLAPLRKAGLQPVGIDLSAFGLIRALADSVVAPASKEEGEQADTGATLFCNIGDATNLAVAKGRACLFTRVAPIGIESIASNLSETAGLTPEHAGMWLDHVGLVQPAEEIGGDPEVVAATRRALEQGASTLQDELRLSLDFYAAQEGALPIGSVVLGGPGSAITGLPERVEAFLGLPTQVGRPAALAEIDAAAAARLTLPYGIALDS